jgi:putative ABC transport system substrate-binding protein
VVAAFRRGLAESGYVEGKTVTVEYRWALGQYDRLPTMAAELTRRPVAVLVADKWRLAGVVKRAVSGLTNCLRL